MLSMPTGIGHGASAAHEDAFKKICKKEAREITGVFNAQFDAPFLAGKFPGQPRLAYFELSANEESDVAGICAQTLQLSQAGYRVNVAQLSERTGYDLAAVAPPTLQKENV
jgi:hypothetical protein